MSCASDLNRRIDEFLIQAFWETFEKKCHPDYREYNGRMWNLYRTVKNQVDGVDYVLITSVNQDRDASGTLYAIHDYSGALERLLARPGANQDEDTWLDTDPASLLADVLNCTGCIKLMSFSNYNLNVEGIIE